MSYLFAFIAAATLPAAGVNCLDRKTWKDALPEKLCMRVIDGLKARQGEYAVINCLGELEDGYAAGRCQAVDVQEQVVLRDDMLTRLEPRLDADPVYFAGKDENCLNDAHKPKVATTVQVKLAHLTEVTQRVEGGSEAYCVVPGDFHRVRYTASPGRCKVLATRIGRTVTLGVVGDHVCDIR